MNRPSLPDSFRQVYLPAVEPLVLRTPLNRFPAFALGGFFAPISPYHRLPGQLKRSVTLDPLLYSPPASTLPPTLFFFWAPFLPRADTLSFLSNRFSAVSEMVDVPVRRQFLFYPVLFDIDTDPKPSGRHPFLRVFSHKCLFFSLPMFCPLSGGPF